MNRILIASAALVALSGAALAEGTPALEGNYSAAVLNQVNGTTLAGETGFVSAASARNVSGLATAAPSASPLDAAARDRDTEPPAPFLPPGSTSERHTRHQFDLSLRRKKAGGDKIRRNSHNETNSSAKSPAGGQRHPLHPRQNPPKTRAKEGP